MEQPNISSDLIRGHIDTIVLNSLISSDKNVQEIVDFIEEKSEGQYDINQATLYSSLKRLESLDEIVSYWHSVEGGRRKFFKITEKGIVHVNENLSSWSFSRKIINKLLGDNSFDKEIKYVEKPVYVEKKPENTALTDNAVNIGDSPTVQFFADENEKAVSDKKETASDDIKEVNFRNILNGLIFATVKHEKEDEVIKPVSVALDDAETDNVELKPEVAKLNEVIDDTELSSENGGKIDFGDLAVKAAKEGYKIRISTKDTVKSVGKLYINKLRFIASFITFFVAIAEFFALFFIVKGAEPLFVAIVSAVVLVCPLVYSLLFFIDPVKTTDKSVNGDELLTAAIICFNVLIVTAALNLLLGADFSNHQLVAKTFFTPIILAIDVTIYFAIKLSVSKKDFVRVKK